MKSIVVGIAALFASALLHAAEVQLSNAWMRPAPAGANAARAYVDISSNATLDLVGATTPIARSVAIVHVGTIGDASTEQVVKSFAVPAGTTTRLAYLGDHLRLTSITKDVGNGDPVPLTLVFKDAAGKRIEATTRVVIRGILRPELMPETSRDAPPPTGK
jgi:periplasmic copper chaperone A